MNLLALSGSLRTASLNSMLLRAAARIAPPGITIELYHSLGDLPLFNPDLNAARVIVVEHLRVRINAADGLIIASPEYAHGVTGVMKNALDWMVGNESFVGKPIALFNTSPRAFHAQAALRETLVTMSARIIDDACMAAPILGSNLDENTLLRHTGISETLLAAIRALGVAAMAPDA